MLDTRQQRAIQKAMALGGARLVQRVRFGLYTVPSASREGLAHTVRVDDQGRYTCSCEAGLAGNPCWAQAAVYIAKLEANSKVRVTRPASN